MRQVFLLSVFLYCLGVPSPSFGQEHLDAVPARYATLALNPLRGIFDFEYKNFSDADRQSVIVRSKHQGSFLVVLDRPIYPRSKDIGRLARHIIPGKSRLHISNGDNRVSRNVIAVYQLRDREHERSVIKFLRAND